MSSTILSPYQWHNGNMESYIPICYLKWKDTILKVSSHSILDAIRQNKNPL